MPDKSPSQTSGERIAKVIARAGLASRREAETWIAAGRVSVNGALISSPALNVTPADRIAVDGAPLRARERTRLFLYHKPRGLVTTHSDPEGRDTIFRALPKGLPRLISVGRLDINTEGLLLLTNDGGLARVLELPATGWLRRYRVRALGRVRQEALDRLRTGVTIDGIRYGPIEATLDREQGANVWLTFGIREGKNREVRKVLETLGLRVNRLIRVAFGPFELGDLEDGAAKEIETAGLRASLGERIVAEAGADFDAPASEDVHAPSGRHTEMPAHEPREPHHRRGKRKPHRRDRSGGPRPKHPRPR
jgi:23S rRNA pseudouridine2605 synthase